MALTATTETQLTTELALNQRNDFETLDKIHQNSMLSDGTNDHLTQKIVDILGGIDTILTHYISTKNSELLTDSQINKLCDALSLQNNTNSQQIQRSDQHNEHSSFVVDEKTKFKGFTYSFSEKNTYLYSIFDDQTANRIIKLIYNKLLIVIFAITVFSYFIVEFAGIPGTVRSIYVICITTAGIIWLSLIMTNVNKTAFKMVIKTFEFWLKELYALFTVVAIFILYFFVRDNNPYKRDIKDGGAVYSQIMISLSWIMIIAWMSSLDAMAYTLRLKIVFSLGISIFSFVFLIWISYATYTADEKVGIVKISDKLQISLFSFILSGWRIITLFICKQTYGLLWNWKHGKNSSTLLNTYPEIKWIDQ